MKLKSFMIMFLLTVPAKAELYVFKDNYNGLYGFKDAKGKVVVKPLFDGVYGLEGEKLFSADNPKLQHIVPVFKNDRIIYVKKDGSLAFEGFYFDNGPDYYQEGLARFVKDGKMGFHNEKGEIIIPAKFDFASPFKENGSALVCQGCWGEYSSPPKLKLAHSQVFIRVYDNPVEVKGGKWGAIGKDGHEIVKVDYDTAEEVMKILSTD